MYAVTQRFLQTVLDVYSGGILAAIKKAIDGRDVAGRFAALEKRVSGLEKRPLLKYAGVWTPGERYAEGQLATHAGGLWLATEETKGTPGSAASGFRLIVKSGHAQ